MNWFMKSKIILFTFVSSFIILLFVSCKEKKTVYDSWEVYGGSKEGIRYSSLREIDTGNVHLLNVAWIFNSGDADTAKFSQIQCNPIIIDSVMLLYIPHP